MEEPERMDTRGYDRKRERGLGGERARSSETENWSWQTANQIPFGQVAR